jgi:hypothetical protein
MIKGMTNNWFDSEYFDNLCRWIRSADNGMYDMHKLSRDINKFSSHLKWYKLKNRDYREVDIKESTAQFKLSDIYVPMCMKVGFMPEETRLKRMERIWKCLEA